MSGAAPPPEAPALDPGQQSRIKAQQRQQEAVFHKDRVGFDVFDLFIHTQSYAPLWCEGCVFWNSFRLLVY